MAVYVKNKRMYNIVLLTPSTYELLLQIPGDFQLKLCALYKAVSF